MNRSDESIEIPRYCSDDLVQKHLRTCELFDKAVTTGLTREELGELKALNKELARPPLDS